MKKLFKKTFSLLLCAVLALSCCSAFAVFAQDDIAINSVNFPDSTWRQLVKTYYDTDGNSMLSQDEASAVTTMNVLGILNAQYDDGEITDLTGIEYFTSLEKLYCSAVGLTSLDVSSLTDLTLLFCMGNELTTLDVSANTNLITLNCSNNDLTQLTLGTNSNMITLSCYANALTSIDTSGVVNLTTLMCYQNELTSLDLFLNTQLTSINISDNHLSSVDLRTNTLLEGLTDYELGNQTVSAQADLVDGEIQIYVPVNDTACVVSSSMDVEETDENGDIEITYAYINSMFYAPDYSYIKDGFSYDYDTLVSDSEYMSVYVEVTRSFYVVEFYSDENMDDLISYSYVTSGAAQEPDVSNITPQCKALSSWSEDISDISSDMSVYPVWQDNHSYELFDFDFTQKLATINCSVCTSQYDVYFPTAINARSSDDNYCEYLDLNNDGIINAKDYALILDKFS